MATPLNDESKRLLRFLDDGEWHDLGAIKARLAATVAPGKALRKYEEKANQYHARYAARVGPELPDQKKILSGQKLLANVAVRSMKRNYIELRDLPGQGPQVRLRPGTDLGLLLPPKMEKGFDAALAVGDPGVAVEGEPGRPPADLPEPDRRQPPPAAAPADPFAAMGVCPACGLYIANAGQHEEFHRLNEQTPPQRPVEPAVPERQGACAFFSEDQVRALVRREVEGALDAFQRGMQNWLIHRFASLEALSQGLPRTGRSHDPGRRQRTDRRSW